MICKMYKSSRARLKQTHIKSKKRSSARKRSRTSPKKSGRAARKHSRKRSHKRSRTRRKSTKRSHKRSRKRSRARHKSTKHSHKRSRARRKSTKRSRKRSYRFYGVIDKNNNYLRNLKCGTTNIEELVGEVVKTWQMKNDQNKQDEFYLEGSYVKYVIDTLLGFPPTPISDIDFHAEIKQQRTMRNETRNFAQHVIECLEKYDINYTEHTNFMYKHEITNITIVIKFLNKN